MTSEFGRGLTYCLALFLCHSEREFGTSQESSRRDAELWFNAASDHLYDLEIPETLPLELRDRLSLLRDKALTLGHGFPNEKATDKDKDWAVQEAKDLLREIDTAHGVTVVKGDWE